MIVGVMTTSDPEFTKKYSELASSVGATIAEGGFHLLTGGGRGLMEIVGKAFKNTKRKGLLINILRAKGTKHLTGPWDKDSGKLKLKELDEEPRNKRDILPVKKKTKVVKRAWEATENNKLGEITIRTHLPYSSDKGELDLSRNHINVLTSDAVIVLPGGDGTLSELTLACEYGRPVAVFLGADGSVGGPGAKELKAKFSGIKLADEKNIRGWLLQQEKKMPKPGRKKPSR
jgi:SLOG cluster4 family